MTRRIFILFAAIVVTFSCCAAQEAQGQIHGLLNGRGWMQLEKESKLLFVTSLQEFVTYHVEKNDREVGRIGEDKKVKLAEYLSDCIPMHQAVYEIVGDLDAFYADAANTKVPVLIALRLLAMKARGIPEAAMQAMREKVRSGDYIFN